MPEKCLVYVCMYVCSYVPICYNLLYVAIATAAMEMLAGDVGIKMSRKPEIMADAAYAIFLQTCDQMTGQFLIDDDVVKKAGITDLDQYANSPGEQDNRVTCHHAVCACMYYVCACVRACVTKNFYKFLP